MHDILRERLMRKIESLPEEQVYQTLDYIEFLESKYGTDDDEETSGLRRFAEAMEDKLRKKAMSPARLREAFQLISAADRVLSNVSSAGRRLMEELTTRGEGTPGEDEASPAQELSPGDEPPSEDQLSTEDEPPSKEEISTGDEPSSADERPQADEPSSADERPQADEPSSADERPQADEPSPEDELSLVDQLLPADELRPTDELPPIDGLPPVDGSPGVHD